MLDEKTFSPSRELASETRTFLRGVRAAVELRLDGLIPTIDTEPRVIHEAMRWSLFAGGKRFRPALLVACGECFAASHRQLMDAACAFEILHTYSLIHDDLPAMDDDDLRRGIPTCHKQYGDAMAILAGDALQNFAYEIIANDDNLKIETRLAVIKELARAASTPHGMIAGQVRDLIANSNATSIEQLDAIHAAKTGALIAAAARCGAIIADASSTEIEIIGTYAEHLGLLFQITDDILDATSTAEELGKTPGKDATQNKATYATLYGLANAHDKATQAHRAALDALDALNRDTTLLRSLATLILNRRT